MQPLIKRAAHNRLDLFPETLRMVGAGVGLERFTSLPYLYDREVVQSAILHQ